MQLIQIKDEDIDNIEQLLDSSGKIKFESDSRKIIKYMYPCFIQACPGSGKTTSLIAKLAILADKLDVNQNICVLSHTNVAKDEIINRLGNKAEKLLKYPNFIGTIQSFVDTYLATPAMIKKFQIRPKEIDPSKFATVLKSKLPFKTIGFLSHKNIEFEEISYNFNNINTLNREFIDTSEAIQNHYNSLVLKSKLVKQEGIITYDDAFALANWYISEYPNLANVISKRFKFVFIDEVQDTSENQLIILSKIFKNSIVQYFGDNNQNLYAPKTNILEKIIVCDERISQDNLLTISNSYRLSPNICNISKHVCRQQQCLSSGNEYICGNKFPEDCQKCDNCQNTIILYENNSIKDVLPLFVQIIEKQKIKKIDMENCFKCVGQVGKKFTINEKQDSNGVIKVSLPDYYEDFFKVSKSFGLSYSQIVNFKTILVYIEKYIKENDFKEAKKLLLRTVIKILNIQNFKDVQTISDLKNYFKEKNKSDRLNDFLFLCCDSTVKNQIEYEKIQEKMISLLKEFGIINLNDKIKAFLNDAAVDMNTTDAITTINNTYICPITGIEIKIDTIASVKGETHDATLLVETYMRSKDLKKFLKLIANDSFTEKQWEKIIEDDRLNNIYVAMTRPKHLLCLAMHKDSFEEKYRENLENLGWQINTELIS